MNIPPYSVDVVIREFVERQIEWQKTVTTIIKDNGYPIVLLPKLERYGEDDLAPVEEWCDQHMNDFTRIEWLFGFKSENDAFAFKLRWL